MDKYLWLETPIHKNSLSEDILNVELFDSNFKITLDGSILAIKRTTLSSYMDSDDSKMIRLGMKNPPKKMKIKTIDDFYKYLSYQKFVD